MHQELGSIASTGADRPRPEVISGRITFIVATYVQDNSLEWHETDIKRVCSEERAMIEVGLIDRQNVRVIVYQEYVNEDTRRILSVFQQK